MTNIGLIEINGLSIANKTLLILQIGVERAKSINLLLSQKSAFEKI